MGIVLSSERSRHCQMKAYAAGGLAAIRFLRSRSSQTELNGIGFPRLALNFPSVWLDRFISFRKGLQADADAIVCLARTTRASSRSRPNVARREDDPLYPVYVQFERFRAAQYSRELSDKVFRGCVKIAEQNYLAGGSR